MHLANVDVNAKVRNKAIDKTSQRKILDMQFNWEISLTKRYKLEDLNLVKAKGFKSDVNVSPNVFI